MHLIAVDLPAPLGPARTVISPGPTVKLKSSLASSFLYRLVRWDTVSMRFSFITQTRTGGLSARLGSRPVGPVGRTGLSIPFSQFPYKRFRYF